MPHTEEIESGLLPTATTSGNYNRKGLSKNSGDGLATAINKMLPIPTANTGKNLSSGINWGKREEKSHLDGVWMNRFGKKHGYKLQPEFVEWMMGYPEGWTELND